MKTQISIALVALSTACFFGCGESSESKGNAAETPKTTDSATNTNAGSLINDIAGTAKEQVSKATENLKELSKDASTQVNALVKQLDTKINELKPSMDANSELKSKISTLTEALADNDYDEVISKMKGLSQLSLSSGDKSIVDQIKNLSSALIVNENLEDNTTVAKTDLQKLTDALVNGKTSDLVAPLKNILTNAKLTDDQQDMMKSLLGYLNISESNMNMLNQSVEFLKGLNK